MDIIFLKLFKSNPQSNYVTVIFTMQKVFGLNFSVVRTKPIEEFKRILSRYVGIISPLIIITFALITFIFNFFL